MGMDINYDGKVKYLEQLARRAETTSTIAMPTPIATLPFDQANKMQKKAYRANSESQTIYKEKTRDKKSLINF
jgi:hypothetical protein